MDPNSATSEYQGASGTSFSAPVAAGAIALLRYYYSGVLSPSPAMYKAMLVANARSLTGSLDRLQTYLNGTTATVPWWPAPSQGFGTISLDQVLSSPQRTASAWVDQSVTLSQGDIYTRTVTVSDPSKPMRIVLAWTDVPGSVDVSPTLRNDLDLSAFLAGDSNTFVGNSMDATGYSWMPCRVGPGCQPPWDRLNNVEVLNFSAAKFSNPSNRTVILYITARNLAGKPLDLGGGGNTQDFAVYIINGNPQ